MKRKMEEKDNGRKERKNKTKFVIYRLKWQQLLSKFNSFKRQVKSNKINTIIKLLLHFPCKMCFQHHNIITFKTDIAASISGSFKLKATCTLYTTWFYAWLLFLSDLYCISLYTRHTLNLNKAKTIFKHWQLSRELKETYYSK